MKLCEHIHGIVNEQSDYKSPLHTLMPSTHRLVPIQKHIYSFSGTCINTVNVLGRVINVVSYEFSLPAKHEVQVMQVP